MNEHKAKIAILSAENDIYKKGEYPILYKIIENRCHAILIDEDADPMISKLSASSVSLPIRTKLINFELEFGQFDDILYKVIICELDRYKKEHDYPNDPWLRKNISAGSHTLINFSGVTVLIKLLDKPEDDQLRVFSGALMFKYTSTELCGLSLYGLDLTDRLESSAELQYATRALTHSHSDGAIDIDKGKLDYMARNYMAEHQSKICNGE